MNHKSNSEPGAAFYMAEAIAEAKKAWGNTHPNPLVGAVIVENGEVVARGFHARAGEAHAEVNALRHLGRKPEPGAAIYVTLEPCCTTGRTGACTHAIMTSGIKTVIVGALDPNPQHAGKGIDILKDAGIHVETGVLSDECADLNLIFNHWIVEQAPMIAGKIAMTLDGKIATRTGQSKWITGAAARENVMHWRRYFPAIAVGAETVRVDNPSLTSRVEGAIWCPQRFVFDRSLKTVTDLSFQVYSDEFVEKTTVVTALDAPEGKINALRERGIDVWQLPSGGDKAYFSAFLDKCKSMETFGVYVEGGGEFLSALLNTMIVNYLFIYKAPKILGDSDAKAAFSGRSPKAMGEALQLSAVVQEAFGDDSLTRGKIVSGD